MSNNELEILLTLRDKATAQLKKFQSFTKRSLEAMKKNWLAITVAITAMIVVLKKAADAIAAVAKELIKVNSTVENLQVRLTVLTGSVEAGNKVFADMRDLASQVPQTYEEIMTSATDLTAVISGGSEELNKLMPIILDLSAATGIGVQETTSQMIRMYSAGAAAADLFRERGVLAALGFQAGVSVSAEETINRITQQWEDGTGKFVGATELLSETFSGQVSMMEDAWFNFKQQIGAAAFEKAKLVLEAILIMIKKSKKETGGYEKLVSDLDSAFSDMFDAAIFGAGGLFVAVGQTLDILNEMRIVVLGVQGAWLTFIAGIFQASVLIEDVLSKIPGSTTFIDPERNKAALEEVKADIEAVSAEITELRIQADIDYSEKFKSVMGGIMETYNELKVTIIKNQEEINKAQEDGVKTAVKLTDTQQKQVDKLTKSTEKAFASAISGMIQGTTTAKEAFTSLGQKMIQILADFLAEQIVAITVSQILGKVMEKFVISSAVAIAAAWAPAAALASLATLGANAAPATAALALTTAFSQGLAALGAGATPLAEGGIVTKPTLALIGEAGPEAVVPLGSSGGFRSINIEVNISDPQVRSLDDIYTLSEEVSDQVAKEIERL